MKELLLTGTSGLVGSRFVELYGSKHDLLTPNRHELDITNRQSVTDYFSNHQPDVVINFAAYTNVGEGEKQRGDRNGDCWKINVDGVSNLLGAIDITKTNFVQISTDYIFPATKDDPGPYSENHLPEEDSNKVTWYGFSKAEAERVIFEKLGDKAAILRLIYPVRAKYEPKLDYLRKPLKAYDDGKLLPLFTDQQVSITFIDEACQALQKIAETKTTGIFHASSSDLASPLDLVSYLLFKTRNENGPLKSWSIEEFFATGASPVRYPKIGGLKVEETEKRLGIKLSTWKEIIDKLVEQGVSV